MKPGAKPSQWLAFPAGVDSRAHARQLRQSWERLLAERGLRSESHPEVAGALRQPIVDSWRRSLDTGLDPAGWLAPIEADPTEIKERWWEHPLGSLARVLSDELETIAEDLQSLIVVSDATGLLLHLHGSDSLKERAAADMNFLEGASWSEAAAGTNAIGTALAEDHALQVFSFEHFNPREHGWTCSAAPVHDPMSGRVVGIVDLTGPWKTVHPASLPLVTGAARTMERCLADARRDLVARLRRRYGDLALRTADLLVSGDGYVLAGELSATPPRPLTIPEGGGEILLGDGSVAAAETLGHGEAYLVRRIGPSAVGAAPTKAAERADEDADEDAKGPLPTANVESGRLSAEPGRHAVSAYFEAALDCVIMADASGRVVEFNSAAERTFGYSRDEALGRTMAELIVPPSLRERHSTAFARFIETGQGTMLARRLELTGMRADGSEFPVELALSQVEGEPFLICGALRDISAAKQAERHLRELADEQAALRRVATLVAREASPQQLFASVAEQVAQIIDVPLVRLVRYESDGSAVELIGGWGESVDPLSLGTRWQLDGPGVLASVWRSRLPARLDDYTDVPGQAALVVRQAGMRSAVASPITVEGRLWGAIAVLSPRREPLPEGTEARLADFTELIVTAISNTEARDGERRLAEEQAALRRVAELVAREASQVEVFAAVADAVSGLLGEEVRMVRYEANDAVVVAGSVGPLEHVFPVGSRVPLGGNNAVSRVFRTGKPVRIDDYREATGPIADTVSATGMRSVVATPIVVEGRLWGTMVVAAFRDEPIAPQTESRLAQFTELVATALANAESRAELAGSEARARKLAEEQAALRRVATLVARESSPDEIFSIVAEEVGQVLCVPIVVLVRYETDGSVMRVLGGWSERAFPVPMGTRLLLDGPSHFADVWATGRSARLDDPADLPGEIAAAMRHAGVGSGAASPILVEGRIWGAIAVGLFGFSDRLPADIEARLADFTELVATAIANSEARDNLRRLVDEQAALRRVATLVAEGASAEELFSSVAEEAAGVIGLPFVGVHRYEPDATFTMVARARAGRDTSFTVGSRWPVEAEGLAGMILASGRPARKDDYSRVPGPVGAAVRHDGMAAMVGVPIVADGKIWGFMVAGGGPGEPIPAGTEEHLARFTELVATAVSNATIRAELAASRARVIAAADEARRRIERDLHDGAQQQLVALTLGLRSAEGRVPAELEDIRTEVGGFADRLTSVIEELREMSRGIHPAILTEGGLGPAVEALALRSPVPIRLNVCSERRLPDAIEVAAYYAVSEALTNTAKHAEASRVEVDLHVEDETLCLSVVDDGVGGAKLRGGSGLIGLKDRVEALGGTIDVASPPGSGTRLDIEIPLLADPSVASNAERLSPA